MTAPTPPGWYPDPSGASGQRYWDGTNWTETPPPPPPPPPPQSGQYGHPGSYPPPGGGPQPGGLGVRIAARVIDNLIVAIPAGIILALAWSAAGSDTSLAGLADSHMVTGLLVGLLTFAYYVTFEVTQGWTPAKKLLGLSVHGPDGAAKPDFQQSAIRNSWTLFPILPFIGGLLGLVAITVIAITINSSPTKQGKHDELAGGTQVLKD